MVTKQTSIDQQRLIDRFNGEPHQDPLSQDQFCAQVLAQLEGFQLHRREAEHKLTDIQGKPGDLAEIFPEPLQMNEHSGCAAQVQESLADPVRSSLGSDFGSNLGGQWSSINIRADLGNISECGRNCNCSCHIRRRFKSPCLLDGFLGTLFIGYTGSPLLSQRCDQVSCRGQRNSSTNFTYQFPRRFLTSRMIELKAKVTALYGPEVSLRFNRVVDGRALVFHYATTGDLCKMKELFRQSCASPNDVRSNGGWTPFHVSILEKFDIVSDVELLLNVTMEQYAIQNNQIEICKLLLQAGGDPYMETEAPT